MIYLIGSVKLINHSYIINKTFIIELIFNIFNSDWIINFYQLTRKLIVHHTDISAYFAV